MGGVAGVTGAATAPAVARVVDDVTLRGALDGLLVSSGYGYSRGDGGRPLDQIATVASVMDGGTGRRGITAIFGSKPADPTNLPTTSVPWYMLLGRLGAVAFRAALAATPEDSRATLASFLRALAAAGYPSRSAKVRLLTVEESASHHETRLTWTSDRTRLLGPATWHDKKYRSSGFEYERNSRFELPKELTLVSEERPGPGWGDEKTIERFLATLEKRGPVPWDPAAVDLLQRHTGLGRAAAALLLVTLPSIDSYEHNFLPAATREQIGIKLTDAKAARDELKALTRPERLAILDAAMPANPDELWDRGLQPVAERMAAAWVRIKGRTVAIDDATLAIAGRFLQFQGGPADPLRLLANPGDPRLNTEPAIVLETGWGSSAGPADAFTSSVVRSLAITIPWAHGALPVGHPLPQGLPQLLGQVRARLQSPTLVLYVASITWPGHLDALRAMGARPWVAPRGARVGGDPLELGPLIALPTKYDLVKLYLRPALMTQQLPPALMALLPATGLATVWAVMYLARGSSEAVVRRAVSSPLPAGGWEADPGQSAPDLVRAVSAGLGVPEDSARLFLQLLALPAPMKAQIRKWNGWTAAAWTSAAKPLLDAYLVVTAQRTRAGRDLFLAGPWVDIDAPDLPVEAWKLPMYGARRAADGSVTMPLDRLLPLVPLHELFANAWARWQAGDRPGFDELPGRR